MICSRRQCDSLVPSENSHFYTAVTFQHVFLLDYTFENKKGQEKMPIGDVTALALKDGYLRDSTGCRTGYQALPPLILW